MMARPWAGISQTLQDGITVSVTTNISYADTFSLAVRIAQAFTEQPGRPARK
ncbi:MAG TPA: hypothetical protein VM120_04820 [Bryobacteraceae bacterium]|nr:hypothetical protein [Bryobacteraceae bacterium]